jgi:hypothetical protein
METVQFVIDNFAVYSFFRIKNVVDPFDDLKRRLDHSRSRKLMHGVGILRLIANAMVRQTMLRDNITIQ